MSANKRNDVWLAVGDRRNKLKARDIEDQDVSDIADLKLLIVAKKLLPSIVSLWNSTCNGGERSSPMMHKYPSRPRLQRLWWS